MCDYYTCMCVSILLKLEICRRRKVSCLPELLGASRSSR